MTARTGFVEVDGTRLAWTRSGPRDPARPSLVLAHGLTDSAACWERVATELASTDDVVRYDARGHGLSDRAGSYSFERHTDDLIGLARALGLERPVLIGHSMGGAHAAVAAPELDARAVVAEDPHWPEVPEDGSKDVAASRRRVVEVAALPVADRRAYGRALHPSWDDADVEPWVLAQLQLDPDVVSWFDSWRTTNRWREHVAALRCPGLLLTGDQTPTVTTRAGADAQDRWPELQVVRLAGAGHNVRRDRFEPYLGAVRAFLRGR